MIDFTDRVAIVTGAGRELGAVNQALAGARILRRTFAGDPAELRELKRRGEAKAGRVVPDLSLWFNVKIAAGRTSLAGALNALNARSEVEIAHPAPRCEPAVILSEGARPGVRRTASLKRAKACAWWRCRTTPTCVSADGPVRRPPRPGRRADRARPGPPGARRR